MSRWSRRVSPWRRRVSPWRRRVSVVPASLRPARPSRAGGLRSPREEMAEATAHGQVYLRRLRRAQLSLSLLALVAFGAVFGVMPLAFLVLPRLERVTILGIPITIWLMIVPMLPLFLAIGWLYVRRADALDEAFRDAAER